MGKNRQLEDKQEGSKQRRTDRFGRRDGDRTKERETVWQTDGRGAKGTFRSASKVCVTAQVTCEAKMPVPHETSGMERNAEASWVWKCVWHGGKRQNML